MGKRVLVAVDSYSPSEAAISYGTELAIRMKSSLALLAISSSRPPGKSTGPVPSRQQADICDDRWMDHVVGESQQRGVNLEIFVASGRFFEEVSRFVQSQPTVQFIVMAAPKDREAKRSGKFAIALEHLHHEFEGEILLVEKAGQITRVSDLYSQGPQEETQV